MSSAYPLQWPDGWDRTPANQREDGRNKFKRGDWRGGYTHVSMATASGEMLEELRLLGASGVTISSNVALRRDGLPRSGQKTPSDPGVAVYFTFGGAMAMARDAFTRPEDNLRSLTLAIAGMRQMHRHGGGAMIERAFVGFAALPPPDKMSVLITPPPRNWWDTLGVTHDAPWAVIKGAYRGLVMATPEDDRAPLNLAYDAAKKARGEA